MLIGSHVGMSGKEMFLGSAKEAVSYGANALMVYTGAPQNTKRKAITELNIDAGWDYLKAHGIEDLIIHAPYIINLGNTTNPDTFDIAVEFLAVELERSAAMGSHTLVLHPGAHVGAGTEAGIRQIVKGINEVLTADSKCNIALETMAGKGTEIGRTFEEIAQIYDGVIYNEKLRVCFDTCHTNDAGYDIVNDFDGVMAHFDKVVGKEQIAVFHLNDSKNSKGAAKDRHENIGFGTIGFDALHYVATHPDFVRVPKILESPYVLVDQETKRSAAPYRYEIAMLKAGKFDPEMQEKIITENQK
ncbi:MAG: deoxyribonuclease IV [Lachnospiraceae bacterium]